MPIGAGRLKSGWHRIRVLPPRLLVILALPLPLHAEETVFPPGSRVGLAPPAGMAVSPDFTGFMDREAGTSIMITAMPRQAYEELTAAMTAERLAPQGMTLLGPCGKVTTAFESRCYRVSQEAGGYLFQKWLLIAKLESETAMVVATLPDAVLTQGIYSAATIEAVLSSLAYSEAPAGNPVDAMPFTIEEGDLLPFQQTMGGSVALYAGAAGAAGLQPLWVVASSLDNRAEAREIAFSRMAFQQIASLSEARVTDERPVALGRLEGHVLEGTGKDQKTGSDLYVFQAILVDASNKYYRLAGLVPAEQRALYRPEFLRLMETLQPR